MKETYTYRMLEKPLSNGIISQKALFFINSYISFLHSCSKFLTLIRVTARNKMDSAATIPSSSQACKWGVLGLSQAHSNVSKQWAYILI
jgi:hypothetical protein